MNLLRNDQANLAIVARHLRQLADIDFAGKKIGDEEMRIIGARYNRGPDLALDKIKKDTSYGNAILKRRDKLNSLLSDATVGSRIIPAGPRPVTRG